MQITVTHFYHSGVCIETETVQLFFDVITDVTEWIAPEKQVYFFVTHGHEDHFKPEIYSHRAQVARYIVSDDVTDRLDTAVIVKPNEIYSVNELVIKTYGSTDRGVSFLVEYDGYRFFHAGDLNWWHWPNDTKQVQDEEARQFKAIVDGIEKGRLDVACFPVDPRLGEGTYFTGDYVMDHLEVACFVPLHFGERFEITAAFKRHRKNDGRIMTVDGCNVSWHIKL